MTTQQEIICRGLLEFVQKIEGDSGWVTFTANGDEHWVQYCRGQINMDWPFTAVPEPERLMTFFGSMAPLKVAAWDSDLFVTIDLANATPELLVPAIDQVFRELYSLGDSYRLKYEVEEG